MSVVDMDEQLDRMLDERALERLDFEPGCRSKDPECDAVAEWMLACRTEGCTLTSALCSEHLDKLRRYYSKARPAMCLICGRTGLVDEVLQVWPIGGVA